MSRDSHGRECQCNGPLTNNCGLVCSSCVEAYVPVTHLRAVDLQQNGAVQDDAWVRSSSFRAQWMHYQCAQAHFRSLNQAMTPPVHSPSLRCVHITVQSCLWPSPGDTRMIAFLMLAIAMMSLPWHTTPIGMCLPNSTASDVCRSADIGSRRADACTRSAASTATPRTQKCHQRPRRSGTRRHYNTPRPQTESHRLKVKSARDQPASQRCHHLMAHSDVACPATLPAFRRGGHGRIPKAHMYIAAACCGPHSHVAMHAQTGFRLHCLLGGLCCCCCGTPSCLPGTHALVSTVQMHVGPERDAVLATMDPLPP